MMKPSDHPVRRESREAFTLLEVICATVILVIAMSIAYAAFSETILGWKRGTEVADSISHGDFAMNQLASALNSTMFFNNQRRTYAFKIEKDSFGGYPADTISFVTTSGAFMAENSPFFKGPHRLKLFIDSDDYNDPALYVLAMPAVANDEDMEEKFADRAFLAVRGISGMEILIWDSEAEDWTDEWSSETSVPQRMLLNLYIESDEEEDPILFSRVIDTPVFDSVKERLTQATVTGNNGGNTGGNTGGNIGAAGNNRPAGDPRGGR